MQPGFVDACEPVELEEVLLVEPTAFEHLERQVGPPRERESVDGRLHVCVFFLASLRFVVEDVQAPVPEPGGSRCGR